jgi:hypothetical protein
MGWPKGRPRFKKNPNAGRKKGSQNKRTLEIGAACIKLAPEMLQRLRELAHNKVDLGTAKSAAALILSYAYGKPKEQVTVTGAGDGPLRFTLALGDHTLGNGHTDNGA